MFVVCGQINVVGNSHRILLSCFFFAGLLSTFTIVFDIDVGRHDKRDVGSLTSELAQDWRTETIARDDETRLSTMQAFLQSDRLRFGAILRL